MAPSFSSSASASMASSFMSKPLGFSSKSFVSFNTPYSVEKAHLDDENPSFSKFSLPTNSAMNLSTIPMSSPKTVRLSSLSFTLDRAPEEPARESTSTNLISRLHVPLLDPLDPDVIESFIEKYDSLGKESNYFDLSKTSK